MSSIRLTPALQKEIGASVSDRPSSARDRDGFIHAVNCNRSVLHHKVGLPLACYLHESSIERIQPYYNLPTSSAVVEGVGASDDHDEIFEKCFDSWLPEKRRGVASEKDLTKRLAGDVQSALNSRGENIWAAVDEHWVKEGRTRGYIDLLVRCRKANEPKAMIEREQSTTAADAARQGVPVLLVEVGLGNEAWWAKVDQRFEYLKCLNDIKGPLLLMAVTIDVNAEKDHLHRIGVFLVTPKRSSSHTGDRRKYVSALLWRDQARGIKTLSQSFGRVLRAARLLVEWDAEESTYQYLGPNCCRIGSEDQARVLRAYDNRLIYTNRRQDAYRKFFKDTTEIVLEFRDVPMESGEAHESRSPLPFGAFEEGSDDRDWMWKFRGCFSVLSVPYHVGRHWALRLSEVIRLVEQLRDLHKRGFVHGDVRACNTVFGAEASHLIDFDLGGEVGGQNPPKFPENYQFDLSDGERKRRRPSSEISRIDDVFALMRLIFFKHDVVQPKLNFDVSEGAPSDEDMDGTSQLQKRLKRQEVKLEAIESERKLLRKKRSLIAFADRDEVSQEEVEEHLGDLIDFLRNVENLGWTVRPTPAFLHAMKLWGFDVSDDGAGNWNDTKQEASHATGSPEKDVRKQ